MLELPSSCARRPRRPILHGKRVGVLLLSLISCRQILKSLSHKICPRLGGDLLLDIDSHGLPNIWLSPFPFAKPQILDSWPDAECRAVAAKLLWIDRPRCSYVHIRRGDILSLKNSLHSTLPIEHDFRYAPKSQFNTSQSLLDNWKDFRITPEQASFWRISRDESSFLRSSRPRLRDYRAARRVLLSTSHFWHAGLAAWISENNDLILST